LDPGTSFLPSPSSPLLFSSSWGQAPDPHPFLAALALLPARPRVPDYELPRFSRDLADAILLSWDVASNTFRLPYFHRNSASEFLASLYGNGLGRSDEFKPGGGSFEGGHTPHGGFSDGYVNEMRIQEMGCRRILEGTFRFVLCRLTYRERSEDGGLEACPHG
jgi:hypothetical protein